MSLAQGICAEVDMNVPTTGTGFIEACVCPSTSALASRALDNHLIVVVIEGIKGFVAELRTEEACNRYRLTEGQLIQPYVGRGRL